MEKSPNITLKILFLIPLMILLTFFIIFFVCVAKVDAQSASSYNIRFMNSNGIELVSADKANLTFDGNISYLLSTGYFDNITAGSYIYFNQKHTLAIRFNPNYIKVTGLKVQYYYVTLSGDSVEMTGFCSDSATLTKDLTYDNSWLYQYKINSTCELKNTYSTDRIIVRISPIYSTSNNSYIIRTAYNINSFSVTNDPSEAELIINNQNQNTQDIIDNNNQNTEDIMNNDDKNTDKITQSQDKTTEAVKENNETNKSILEQIKALPDTLINGFLNMLKNLFIPTEDDIQDIIGKSQDISENFGFVGQSFSFIIDIFTSFLSIPSNEGCIDLPSLELKFGGILEMEDYIMWDKQTVCMSKNEWFGEDTEAIDIVRTIITITLVCAFISWAITQLNEILSKEDTQT